MGTKKDPYVKPAEYDQHLRKDGKKLYWTKSRQTARRIISKILNGNKKTY